MSKVRSDLELMEHADGELDDDAFAQQVDSDPIARTKVESIKQIGELVRGHLELSTDSVPDAKFAAMWRRIDDQLDAPRGAWARITGWIERHRGHLITGTVSAGAVAALALVLRPSAPDVNAPSVRAGRTIDVRPVALRNAPEIDALDTPGGSPTVINLDDEDGHTTVIWVSPEDIVEGL